MKVKKRIVSEEMVIRRCLESTLDAGELPIKAQKVCIAICVKQTLLELEWPSVIMQKKNNCIDCWLRMVFFTSTRYSISIIAVDSDQL